MVFDFMTLTIQPARSSNRLSVFNEVARLPLALTEFSWFEEFTASENGKVVLKRQAKQLSFELGYNAELVHQTWKPEAQCRNCD